ncbi:hypothetical protein Tco_1431579, partial [Tanacetum coccineum]
LCFHGAKGIIRGACGFSRNCIPIASNLECSWVVNYKRVLCLSQKEKKPIEERDRPQQRSGSSYRFDDDVACRIRAGWVKKRVASRVLCDMKVPLKLKGKFYRVAIRPALLYGSECYPFTKAQASRVEVAELRMLRWTCGKTMVDMILNRVFRAELEVETIIHKMREGRSRWFGHVKRRPQSMPIRRVEALLVDGLRIRGRPKLRWENRVKHDMKDLLLSEDVASDRNA